MADKPELQRALVGNVVLQWGMLNMPVDLVPVKVKGTDKVGSFHRLCPECPDPTRLQERLVCENDHGPYQQADLDDNPRRGKTIEGGDLIEVSEEEAAAVKGADLPKNLMELEFCPADQFEASALPDGTAYRLRPGKVNVDGVYAVLRELLSDETIAANGELNLKGSQKPYRLTVWRNMLVLRGYLRPDDMAAFEGVEAVPAEKHLVMARQLLNATMADYDPEAHKNMKRQREAELLAAKADDPNAVAVISKPTTPTATIDLDGALEAMLAGKAA